MKDVLNQINKRVKKTKYGKKPSPFAKHGRPTTTARIDRELYHKLRVKAAIKDTNVLPLVNKSIKYCLEHKII